MSLDLDWSPKAWDPHLGQSCSVAVLNLMILEPGPHIFILQVSLSCLAMTDFKMVTLLLLVVYTSGPRVIFLFISPAFGVLGWFTF